MKTNYLLPTSFKKIGWIMIVISLVYYVMYMTFDWATIYFKMPSIFNDGNFFTNDGNFFTMVKTEIYSTFLPIVALSGFLFIAFSKERDEDEYIGKIRERSFVFAALFSSLLIILSTLFIFGLAYLNILIMDFFVFLFVFTVKFQIELWKFRKENKDEE